MPSSKKTQNSALATAQLDMFAQLAESQADKAQAAQEAHAEPGAPRMSPEREKAITARAEAIVGHDEGKSAAAPRDLEAHSFHAWSGPSGQESLYASLPLQASPTALLLASRKQDAEMGAALLNTLARWDLNEIDSVEPKSPHGGPSTSLEHRGGSILVNWLLASPMQSDHYYYHSHNIDKKHAREKVAVEMMNRGANVWQETPRGSAMARAVFAQNTHFTLAALESAQWDLARAQATRVFFDHQSRDASRDVLSGQDMLTWAAQVSNMEIAEKLLEKGWHPDRLDHDGVPALARSREPKMVELLLKFGANSEIADTRGKTAMSWIQDGVANGAEREKIARLLADAQLKKVKGAKGPGAESQMQALREQNQEALFVSARNSSQSNFLQMAKKFKFDLSAERDPQGRTVLAIALAGGRYTTAMNLLNDASLSLGAADLDGKKRTLITVWARSKAANTAHVSKSDFIPLLLEAKLANKKDVDGLGAVAQTARSWSEALKNREAPKPDLDDITEAMGSLSAIKADFARQEPDGRAAIEHWLDFCLEQKISSGYHRNFIQFSKSASPCLPKMTPRGRDAMLRFALPLALHSRLTQSNQNPAKDFVAELVRAGAAAPAPSLEQWTQIERQKDARQFPAFTAAMESLELAQTVEATKNSSSAPSAGKKPGSMRL